MRALLIMASILLTNGCVSLPSKEPSAAPDGASPSAVLIDRIEAILADDPCVGSLNRWARHYKFQRSWDGLDKDIVDIDLRQAGVFGYRRGRYIISQPDRPISEDEDIIVTADDRRYRVAFGSYEVGLGRLTMESCGPNRD